MFAQKGVNSRRILAEKDHRRNFYLGLLGFQENELEIEEEVR